MFAHVRHASEEAKNNRLSKNYKDLNNIVNFSLNSHQIITAVISQHQAGIK